jgi:hypothetical protein
MVIIQKKTNKYLKMFFLDLFDVKVSKTSSNESILHMSFSIDKMLMHFTFIQFV